MRRLTTRDRERLAADFEERRNAVSSDQLLRVGDSEAILIHPMADQYEFLNKLGVEPENCIAVDAYWRYEDNVSFVEVWSRKAAVREPGIYYRFSDYGRSDNFQTSTSADFVTSDLFIANLLAIIDLINSGKVDAARKEFSGTPIRLAEPPSIPGAISQE